MQKSERVEEVTRYGNLPKPLKALSIALSILGIGLAVFYVFRFSIGGGTLLNYGYYLLFIAIFSSNVFLILPARKQDRNKVPWYDVLFIVLTFGICVYFYLHSYKMSVAGWTNIPLGIILGLSILEGARRAGGNIYFLVTLLLGAYPLFASHMPGMFWGLSSSFPKLIESLVFRGEGLMGIPTKVVAEIIIGFLVFAGVLIASGAGEFFLNLTNSIFGRFRGGPAKVSVVASGFFGSLSGSIFSNIIATGSVTIPTMKKIGYPPHYAGAIEACSSTGGVLMPPVMGAVAFIMCQMIGVEYRAVIAAAAIPSLLYYWGLLMQVDAYAARVGLKGIPKEEIPPLRSTLKNGWPFIAVFLFLLWGLLYMRWEYMAPWYAAGLMFILSFYRKETMMTPRRILNALVLVGRLITQSAGLILPIGFIMAGLTITGVSGSFTVGLVSLGMGNIFLILVLGVIACYIMGMAGMTTAAYIFLSVTLAPAVIQIADLNIMAVNLFIIYYAMLAAITPPVAAGAFLAASMANANPMRTAFQAMRLGVVIYFIPFFFVFNPSLILEGSLLETLYLFALCLVGVVLIAGGLEGYLLKIGKVKTWTRPLLVIAGLLIGFPEWVTSIAGFGLTLIIVVVMLLEKRRLRATERNHLINSS